MKAKYNIAYVATVTGDLGFCLLLNKICSELNVSFLIISSNKRDYKYLLQHKISAVYVGPHVVVPNNNAEVRLGPNAQAYVKCENSYYGLFKGVVAIAYQRMKYSIQKSLDKYTIDMVVQNPGGEVIRGLMHEYCKSKNIKMIYFGEYFKEFGGSVLYSDDRKKLVPNALQYSSTPAKLDTTDSGGVVLYTLPSLQYKNRLVRVFDLLLSRDVYAFVSAVGYRIESIKSKLSSFITNFLAVDEKEFERKDDCKKILIAMNVLAESELFIRNESYSKPLNLLETTKKLKKKYSVFIKGHPGGAKSFSVTDAIRFRIGGVKIIIKEVPASRIIDAFDVIGFVSSTVGIEAIRGNVPILCIGNWPYRFIADAATVESVDQFHSIRVDKDKFFKILSGYIHPGKSYGTVQELKTLIKSILNLTNKANV